MLASLSEALVGALIGAAATLAAVLLGVWLPRRYAERDRIRQEAKTEQDRMRREANAEQEHVRREANRLRVDGAAVVEPVRHLLIEAVPDRLMRSAGPDSRSEFEAFWARWRRLRDDLMKFASGQPSRDVLGVALQLREAVEISLMSSAWAVQEVLTGASAPESVETAKQDHQQAVELAHTLRWKIRGEEPPSTSLYGDVTRDPRRVMSLPGELPASREDTPPSSG